MAFYKRKNEDLTSQLMEFEGNLWELVVNVHTNYAINHPISFNEEELGNWLEVESWGLFVPNGDEKSYAPVWICWGILVKGENKTSMALLDMNAQVTILP